MYLLVSVWCWKGHSNSDKTLFPVREYHLVDFGLIDDRLDGLPGDACTFRLFVFLGNFGLISELFQPHNCSFLPMLSW